MFCECRRSRTWAQAHVRFWIILLKKKYGKYYRGMKLLTFVYFYYSVLMDTWSNVWWSHCLLIAIFLGLGNVIDVEKLFRPSALIISLEQMLSPEDTASTKECSACDLQLIDPFTWSIIAYLANKNSRGMASDDSVISFNEESIKTGWRMMSL